MEWDSFNVAALRQMWGEGFSSAQIGLALGTTRNSVIGKTQRLKLPSRVVQPVRTAKMAKMVKLPKMNACQYPTTIDNRHRFLCTVPAPFGQPYCAAHREKCWTKTKAQREAAQCQPM